MLGACLESLLSLEPDYSFTPAILVVDNDKAKSAFPTVAKARKGIHGKDLHYACEPEQGIAKARNRALAFAIEHNFDFVCFIDDDETAHRKWLSGLMHPRWASWPVVYGRRIFDYSAIPEWAKPDPAAAPPVSMVDCKAYTHNVRISRAVFSAIRFDESLRRGGGEDGDYFARARRAGFRAVFTPEAITTEKAHPARMSFWGQVNRAYWIGASSMRETITEKGRSYRFKKLPSIAVAPFIGSAGLVLGAGAMLKNPVKGRRKILKSAKHMAKALGRFVGIFGHVPQSYAKTVGA